MSKILTAEMVLSKTKADSLFGVKNLNLWGNDIEDVKLLRQMPNVEVLSLSVNRISSLKEFAACTKLQELYLRKNNVTDLSELRYLTNLQSLRVLWLWDNPCADHQQYRQLVIKVLPNLVKLDNSSITPEEKAAAQKVDLSLLSASQSTVFEKEEEQSRESEFKYENPLSSNNSVVNRPNEGYARGAPPSKDILKRKENEAQTPKNSKGDNPRSENIICAVLALLKELDGEGLELVKRDIDRKLASLRNK